MLERKDIEEAKNLFKEWDLHRMWHISAPAFIEHTRNKAKDSLSLAIYLLDKLKNTTELAGNTTVTVWIVTLSYYSMFFEVEYLLGLDQRKLPDGTKDTHKTIYLAFLYYYAIKGSEMEQKRWEEATTSRMSHALVLFKELQDETLELQRVHHGAENLDKQREQRHAFTYRITRSAELAEAEKSIAKAREFRELVEEYIVIKKS